MSLAQQQTSAETKVIDLKDVGVARLLFKLLSQRFDGFVTLEQPAPAAGLRTLRVAGGMPMSFDWEDPSTRLGEMLVAAGALEREALVQAIAAQGEVSDNLLGEILVERGAVDEVSVLRAMRAQCERRLVALFSINEGRIEITSGPATREEHAEVPTLKVINLGVSAHIGVEEVRHQMGELPDGAVRATQVFARYRDHFEFSDHDAEALDRLETPEGVSLEELSLATDVSPRRAAQILYTLWICQMLEPAEVVQAPPLDAAKVEVALAAVEAKVRAQASPFEILGIEETADLAEIESAWKSLDRRFHFDADGSVKPDEALETRLEQVRDALGEVREAARQRREILADATYTRLLKERKFARAAPLLKDLVTMHPGDPALQVAYGWCRFRASEQTERDCRRALDELKHAIERQPDLVDAHYYRGMVLVTLHRSAAALDAFETALRLDPDNVEVERQARALRAGRSDLSRTTERSVVGKLPEFQPKKRRTGPRSQWWSGAWPAIWICSGLLFAAMVAAQIVMRMDF